MASFKISDAEADILEELPPELYKLYGCLRRIVDFKTGIAGITHRIDDRFFIERLSYKKKQGRKLKRIQRRDWDRWLKELEEEGLIEIFPNYVFKLILAQSDASDNKEIWGGGNSASNKWCRSGEEVVQKNKRSGAKSNANKLLILKEESGDKKISGAEIEKKWCRSGEEVCTTSGVPDIALDTNIKIHNSLPLDTSANSQKTRNSPEREICEYLNLQSGKNSEINKARLGFVKARLAEETKPSVAECKQIIDEKVLKWKNDPEYRRYLQPETIFNKLKFTGYLENLRDKHIAPEVTTAMPPGGFWNEHNAKMAEIVARLSKEEEEGAEWAKPK